MAAELTSAHAVPKLPARDLDRARRFDGERGAFFRDSEGNLPAIRQATP